MAETPFLEAIPFTENHWFQWKQVSVVETIPFSGIRLSRNHYPLWKTIPFSVRQSFKWNPVLLMQIIPFSGNHSF